MGKSTISKAIFNSFLYVCQRVPSQSIRWFSLPNNWATRPGSLEALRIWPSRRPTYKSLDVEISSWWRRLTWNCMAQVFYTIYTPWRIHGAAIYGNMDPINIPPMLAYIPYMDPMGINLYSFFFENLRTNKSFDWAFSCWCSTFFNWRLQLWSCGLVVAFCSTQPLWTPTAP
jgi:hypothetical protein